MSNRCRSHCWEVNLSPGQGFPWHLSRTIQTGTEQRGGQDYGNNQFYKGVFLDGCDGDAVKMHPKPWHPSKTVPSPANPCSRWPTSEGRGFCRILTASPPHPSKHTLTPIEVTRSFAISITPKQVVYRLDTIVANSHLSHVQVGTGFLPLDVNMNVSSYLQQPDIIMHKVYQKVAELQ